MMITPLEDNDTFVGESSSSLCDDADVDMGTPTAAVADAVADWRETRNHHLHDEKQEAPGRENTQQDEKWRIQHQKRAKTTRAESEEELLAFREFNDADIDGLDISPSQDFAGEAVEEEEVPTATTTTATLGKEVSVATAQSSQRDTCGWLDYRDDAQFREEASEVFDDVIYAPPVIHAQRVPSANVSQAPPRQHKSPDDHCEQKADLRDHPSAPPPPPSTTAAATAQPANDPPWQTRLSVKRDCSVLAHRRAHICEDDLADSSEEFEEKLKLNGNPTSTSTNAPTAPGSVSPSSSVATACGGANGSRAAIPVAATSANPLGFRPKKKRRKVRQLALDSFLQVQPSASY